MLGDNPSEETKEKFRLMLRDNQLNDKEIEIALDQKSNPFQSLDDTRNASCTNGND